MHKSKNNHFRGGLIKFSVFSLLLFRYVPIFSFYLLGRHTEVVCAVVSSVLVGLSAVFYLLVGGKFNVKSLMLNKWLFLWIFVGLYVTLIGFLSNLNSYTWAIHWVLSDTYSYFIVPVLVVMIIGAVENVQFTFTKTLKMVFSLELLAGLAQIASVLLGRYPRTGNSMGILFPFAFAMVLSKRKKVFYIWIVIFICEILLILFSASRTILMETMLTITIIPVILIKMNVVRKNTMFKKLFLILFIVLMFLLFTYKIPMINNRIVYYTSRILSSKSDISILGRFVEARKSLSIWSGGNLITLLLGKGAGAVYYLPSIVLFAGSPKYVISGFYVHNIHIGPVSVLFRSGIVGLFIIYLSLIAEDFKLWLRSNNLTLVIFAYFLLIKIFESFQALRIVGNPVFLLLIGMALISKYKSKERDVPG